MFRKLKFLLVTGAPLCFLCLLGATPDRNPDCGYCWDGTIIYCQQIEMLPHCHFWTHSPTETHDRGTDPHTQFGDEVYVGTDLCDFEHEECPSNHPDCASKDQSKAKH
jgi:hypothetical protein